MTPTTVPTKEQAPPGSRKYFDYFANRLGKMPNLYAVMAFSEHGLETYLQLQRRKRLLNRQETEIIGLVISAGHEADYCVSNHSMIAKLNGLDDLQIREVCAGTAGFDPKLDVLARLAQNIFLTRAKPDPRLVQEFFDAGYTVAHLLDVAITIGDNVISNIISNTMHIPADNPGL